MHAIIIALLLFVIAGGTLTLAAIGGLVLRLDFLAARLDEHADLHTLTRRYIGQNLIEGKLLPAVGYQEPVRSPLEQAIADAWQAETADNPAIIDDPRPLGVE
jgi:hypothetical protein